MKQVLLTTGGAVLVVILIAGYFAMNQANQAKLELTSRMQSRRRVANGKGTRPRETIARRASVDKFLRILAPQKVSLTNTC